MDAISIQDRLIYIMVSISAADSSMTDREMKRIGNVVHNLPVFENFPENRIMEAARACSDILQDDAGLKTILDLAASLPERLHETAYALAVDVAASDLSVAPEEVRFLQLLRDRLNLDRLISAAIERGARARFRSE